MKTIFIYDKKVDQTKWPVIPAIKEQIVRDCVRFEKFDNIGFIYKDPNNDKKEKCLTCTIIEVSYSCNIGLRIIQLVSVKPEAISIPID